MIVNGRRRLEEANASERSKLDCACLKAKGKKNFKIHDGGWLIRGIRKAGNKMNSTD